MEMVGAAIHGSDVGRVRELLQTHPELKSRLNDPLPNGAFGSTALIDAVQRSNRQIIDLLLDAGADINQKSHWWAGGFGVLDDAARPDRPAWLAPYLIERGAVVDIHAAVQLRILERIEQLLATDPALVHARGGDGQTPIHVAPSVEIARLLLERGAQIDARDIDHESTPAQYMIRDRQEAARFLVDRGCHTDILMASALGDIERVRKQLDDDPDCIRISVSEQYFPKRNPRAGGTIYIWTFGWNKTAHLIAREFGHEDVLRLLLDRSPEDLKLSIACELGDEGVFRAMLARQPDLPRTMSDDVRRRVVDAAQNNNANAVRLMLEAGWPVDARGGHRATPLHWASFHGNVEMVRQILQHHPPLEVKGDDFDLTPLGWAIYGSLHGWHRKTGDYAGTVETLLDAGATPPPLSDDLEASIAVREVLRRRAEAG